MTAPGASFVLAACESDAEVELPSTNLLALDLERRDGDVYLVAARQSAYEGPTSRSPS